MLDKIASNAGFNSGYRRLIYVVCNSSPKTLVWQLILEDPQTYSGVIPITGLRHEEMNMVKSFNEMFYDFILKSFFETQGYTTPKALAFAKRCSDHHIAFVNLMKVRESLCLDLIYVYKSVNTSHVSCDFEGFCQ